MIKTSVVGRDSSQVFEAGNDSGGCGGGGVGRNVHSCLSPTLNSVYLMVSSRPFTTASLANSLAASRYPSVPSAAAEAAHSTAASKPCTKLICVGRSRGEFVSVGMHANNLGMTLDGLSQRKTLSK